MPKTAMKARLHLATMHEARWYSHVIARSEYSDWNQVSGDLAASVFGATFARVLSEQHENSPSIRKSPEMVRIFNLESDTGKPCGSVGPYLVEKLDVLPWSLSPSVRETFDKVLMEREVDDSTDVDTLLLMAGQEIADHGGFDSDTFDSYATLADAMKACEIPASALWDASEYASQFQWGAECKHLTNEHIFPRANHAAVIAKAIMEEARGDSDVINSSRLSELRKHLASVIRLIDEEGDAIPEWYGAGVPCAAWNELKPF